MEIILILQIVQCRVSCDAHTDSSGCAVLLLSATIVERVKKKECIIIIAVVKGVILLL